MPTSSSTTSTRGPEPDTTGSRAADGAVMPPRLGHVRRQPAARPRELAGQPAGRRPEPAHRMMHAEAPVEQARRIGEYGARLRRRAIEHHANQRPLAFGGFEEQALAS